MTWIDERSRACVARSLSRSRQRDAHILLRSRRRAAAREGVANGRSCSTCERTLVQSLRTYRVFRQHKIVSVVPSARSSLPTAAITRESVYCSIVRDEQLPLLGDGRIMVGEDLLRHGMSTPPRLNFGASMEFSHVLENTCLVLAAVPAAGLHGIQRPRDQLGRRPDR